MSAQNAKLDNLLSTIKNLEDEKSLLEEKIKTERAEVVSILETETDGQYKNDIATVSFVERKTIKIDDKEKLLTDIQNQNLVKYIDVIPEEVIPERKELNKKFEKDIKEGEFNIDGVTVDVLKIPQIRFNK